MTPATTELYTITTLSVVYVSRRVRFAPNMRCNMRGEGGVGRVALLVGGEGFCFTGRCGVSAPLKELCGVKVPARL